LEILTKNFLIFQKKAKSQIIRVSEKYVLLAILLTVINRKHGLIFLKEKARFLIENF